MMVNTKYKRERVPSNGFKFPAKVYKDKRKLSGIMHRYCQREWFDIFKFISYSRLQDGLYCLCCVLFPTPSPHGQPSLLVKQYSNWKDAKSDLKIHGVCWYHKDAEARMDAFVSTTCMVNPEKRTDLSLSSQAAEQVRKNREFLKSVLKCIEFCGRQGIALRGHRDDGTADELSNKGNLYALLQLRVDSGDLTLKSHLETCAKNASYISKNTQNDLLDCLKRYVQPQIVQEICSQPIGPHYSIMADEVADVSNWEQLGPVVRYVKDSEPVEKLLFFEDCASVTGAALCGIITSALTEMGLDPANCRSQCFDGAGNMAGIRNGCATTFQQIASRAPYFHCASHDLNLVLCKACKVPPIHCMLETVIENSGHFLQVFTKKAETTGKFH